MLFSGMEPLLEGASGGLLTCMQWSCNIMLSLRETPKSAGQEALTLFSYQSGLCKMLSDFGKGAYMNMWLLSA